MTGSRREATLHGLVTVAVALGLVTIFLISPWDGSDQSIKLDVNDVVQNQLAACNDEGCLGEKLKAITLRNGPETAIQALDLFEKTYPNKIQSDFHLVAHFVGRQAAETFGVNGEAFLRCPESFNYGCQHGFFEKALSKTSSPKAAIQQICGTFEGSSEYTAKFKFYCYHGVGHGVMMARAYDLYTSLNICDSLDSMMAQEGCWQGVLMENVNAHNRGEARDGLFSAEDPLAPCNQLNPRYQQQCYINHAGYLVPFFKFRIKAAASACLAAPAPQSTDCLESIGLMVANNGRQPDLLPAGTAGQTLESRTWQLCQEFPPNNVQSCVTAAIDQILNFDGLDIRSANKFCQTTASQYKTACYERLGRSVRSQALTTQAAQAKCLEIDSSADQNACLKGAG